MLPRRPQRQTDHVFPTGDTMLTPERSFRSFVDGKGRVAKAPNGAPLSLCSVFAYSLPSGEIHNYK